MVGRPIFTPLKSTKVFHKRKMFDLVYIESIADYLNDKGLSFLVSKNYETGALKFVGINITKSGKFWRANGKIIAGNIANDILIINN